ncbi:methyltransferase [Nocardiopsis sp. NPDC006938]|uniref:methyltransferase n=1 Tax=Nocardiopsis sp. NPDC006938 TaxID=3364337 RepID=UPI003686422F
MSGERDEHGVTEAEREASARLWALASPVTPMAIRAVATLRIADHLADGPRTAEELGAAAGADPDGLARVLRYLVREGLFTLDGDRFALTDVGAALRTDHPASRLGWFAGDGAHGRADLCLSELAEALRTGRSAYSLRFGGAGFWEDLSADPALSRSFDELMSGRMVNHSETIAQMYEWQALDHVVDVGGGNGSLLVTLLKRFSRPRGTVVDLPGPAAAARANFREAGLADRADAVAGSFFDPLPVSGDAFVLGWILHDWDDDAAVAILRRCAEAAGPAGTVLVAEHAAEDVVSELDLRMLAFFQGRERTPEDLAALAGRAGLCVAGSHVHKGVALVELTVGHPM